MQEHVRAEMIRLLPRLRRFALGLTGNRDDADDLVQIACERALGRVDQWQAGSRVDSWMFRIVQNCFIDRVRAAKLRGDPVSHEEVMLADDKAHLTAELRNLLGHTLSAIGRLPEEQRVVLMLVCIEEYEYREAADILGIPIGTVMSRLARARSKLSDLMGGSTGWSTP